LDYVT